MFSRESPWNPINRYSNLTATRMEGIENIEIIDFFTPIYGTT
jgi:hypothetical protein